VLVWATTSEPKRLKLAMTTDSRKRITEFLADLH